MRLTESILMPLWFAALCAVIGTAQAQTFSLDLVSRQGGVATQAANAESLANEVTPDGRWLLFTSAATDLVPGQVDGNSATDVFLYDRSNQSTVLISRAAGASTTTANAAATGRAISADGRWIVYVSQSTNVLAGLTDTNANLDVFLFDRMNGTTTLISRAAGSATNTANGFSNAFNSHATSADGAYIVFMSSATDVVAGMTDTNTLEDVFLFERATANTRLISGALGSTTATANNQSLSSGLSDDGRWVLFSSSASNLLEGLTDTNSTFDLFVYDRLSATKILVTSALGVATTSANGQSTGGTLSASGEWIVFSSNASNLVSGVNDNNASYDAFAYHRPTATMALVSHASTSTNQVANGQTFTSRASSDGRWIVISTLATNTAAGVVDSNGTNDVYLYDRDTSTSVLMSRALGSATASANGQSLPSRISGDGRRAIFRTLATNIQAGLTDSNNAFDVYVFDRDQQTSTLLSRSASVANSTANGESAAATVDGNGASLVFNSRATDLISGLGDSNTLNDVFVATPQFLVFDNGFED